jgi:hypothetical protein
LASSEENNYLIVFNKIPEIQKLHDFGDEVRSSLIEAYGNYADEHSDKYNAALLRVERSVYNCSGCVLSIDEKFEIPDNALQIEVSVGFLRFIEKVYSAEAYAYAVFPKAVVRGVVNTESRDVSAGGEGGMIPGITGGQRSGQSDAQIDVVNFAGGKSRHIKFDFGWVFVGNESHVPNQLSQTVLLSVPAYLNELDLTVRTGWIDPDEATTMIDSIRESDSDDIEKVFQRALKSYRKLDMRVPLPSDYEALASLIDQGEMRRRPALKCSVGSCSFELVAGTEASIVIEGSRLWRSTVVTLNGTMADRIRVLPDMKGIIASFDSVPAPRGEKHADLRVWTSEGSVGGRAFTVTIVPKPTQKASTEGADAAASDVNSAEIVQTGAPQ